MRKVNHRTKLLGVAVLTICLAATAVAPVSAQDQPEFSDADLAQVGLSEDELRASEPNPSWDGLALFSDDANRVLGAIAEPISVTPYGFGDDLDGTPVINPTGALPVRFGVAQWQLPADWAPPTQGVTDTTAFAQTTPIAPGADIVLVWSEFADDFDFSAGLSLNEGVTLTIPGLPVWNSTFEGDTWEGANLMPTARLDAGVLTFDVFGFAPPQSFPVRNVPAFYYRSGNVMAVGLDAATLEGLVAQGQDANAAAAADDTADNAANRNLLFTPGSAETVTTQAGTGLSQILFGLHFHFTVGALFIAGFVIRYVPTIARLAVFNFSTLAVLQAATAPPAAPAEEEDVEEEVAEEEEPAAAPPEEVTEVPTDDEPRDAPTEEAATDDEPRDADTEETSTSGGGFPWYLVIIAVALLLGLLVWWVPRRRTSTTPAFDEDDVLPGMEDDDDPRDAPTAPEEPPKRVWTDEYLTQFFRTEDEAIWELNDADRARWYELRSEDVETAWANAVATETRLQARLETLVGNMAAGLNADIEKFGDAMGVYGDGIKHIVDESDDIRLLWTEWTREGGVKDMMWWADLADAVVGVTKLGLALGEGTAKLVLKGAGAGDEALDATRAIDAATEGGEAAASGPRVGSVNDIYDGADFAKLDAELVRILGRDFDDYATALPEVARKLGYFMDFSDAERILLQRLISKLHIAQRGGPATFSPSDLALLRRMSQTEGFWENLARAATLDMDARVYRLVNDLELGWLRNLANSPEAIRAADDVPVGLPALPPGGTLRPPGGVDGTPTLVFPPGANAPTVRLPAADAPTVIVAPGAANPTVRIPPPGANNPTVLLPAGGSSPTVILPSASATLPHPGAATLPPPAMPTLTGGGAITLPPPNAVPTVRVPAPGASLPYPGAITLPPPNAVPTVRVPTPGVAPPAGGAITVPPPVSVPTMAPPGGATLPPPTPTGVGLETVRLADGGLNPSGLTNPVAVPTPAPAAAPTGPASIGVDRAIEAGIDGGSGGSSIYEQLHSWMGGGQ